MTSTRTSARWTTPILAVTALSAALTLSACGSSGDTTSTPTDSTADNSASGPASTPSESSPSGSTESSAAPTSSGAPSSDAASGAGSASDACAADALKIRVVQGDAAAGSIGYTITFTNTSKTDCTLDGHPGVSAVGKNNGTQIGASAKRTDEATKAVRLKPGQAATATLTAVNIGEGGGPLGDQCAPVDANGWRIYPPDSKKSVFVAQHGLKVCSDDDADWLRISTVHAAN